LWFGHQTGAKPAGLHPIRRASNIQVNFRKPLVASAFNRQRQTIGLAATKLKHQWMFDFIMAKKPVKITMNNRLGCNHFGKQQRIGNKIPVKDTAMSVSPIHHRCHTKAAVNTVCMITNGHYGFIAFLRANANSQRFKRVSPLGVNNRDNKRIVIHLRFSGKPVCGSFAIYPFCAGDNLPRVIAIEIKVSRQQFMTPVKRINMYKNGTCISIAAACQNAINKIRARLPKRRTYQYARFYSCHHDTSFASQQAEKPDPAINHMA
jgi:hypothetical protein